MMMTEEKTERLEALAEIMEALPAVKEAGFVKNDDAVEVCGMCVAQIKDILSEGI